MESRPMTRRMVAALANPHLDVLGHMTGRMGPAGAATGRSPTFDAEIVFAAARRFDKAIEINSRPERQDPPKRLLRLAVEAGCRFTIDSDAHAPGQLAWLPTGAIEQRRSGVAVEASSTRGRSTSSSPGPPRTAPEQPMRIAGRRWRGSCIIGPYRSIASRPRGDPMSVARGHRAVLHLDRELRGCHPPGHRARQQDPARGSQRLGEGAARQRQPGRRRRVPGQHPGHLRPRRLTDRPARAAPAGITMAAPAPPSSRRRPSGRRRSAARSPRGPRPRRATPAGGPGSRPRRPTPRGHRRGRPSRA